MNELSELQDRKPCGYTVDLYNDLDGVIPNLNGMYVVRLQDHQIDDIKAALLYWLRLRPDDKS